MTTTKLCCMSHFDSIGGIESIGTWAAIRQNFRMQPALLLRQIWLHCCVEMREQRASSTQSATPSNDTLPAAATIKSVPGQRSSGANGGHPGRLAARRYAARILGRYSASELGMSSYKATRQPTLSCLSVFPGPFTAPANASASRLTVTIQALRAGHSLANPLMPALPRTRT